MLLFIIRANEVSRHIIYMERNNVFTNYNTKQSVNISIEYTFSRV